MIGLGDTFPKYLRYITPGAAVEYVEGLRKRLKLYAQPEGAGAAVMLGDATLGIAKLLLRILKVSPHNTEAPASIGVADPRGRFMEFVRISDARYLVRYEDVMQGIVAVGSMPLSRALRCLESFSDGEYAECLSHMEVSR